MAGKKRVTIEHWITEAISDGDKGKPCSGLALVHVKGSGIATEEVHTKPLDGKPQNPTALAAFFIGKAEGYSQDLPGIQTFRLLAFYGTAEPQAVFPFTVADGMITARTEAAQSAHEPTPTGLLGQLMAHNQFLTASHNEIFRAVMGMWTQDRLQMRTTEMEAIAVVRDAALTARRETHQFQMEYAKFQRDSKEREGVMRMVPQLVNRATGREIFDEASNDKELVDMLAMTVKPEDLQMLVDMGKIKKEYALLLMARFAKTLEEKKQEVAALKAAPSEEEEPKKGLKE